VTVEETLEARALLLLRKVSRILGLSRVDHNTPPVPRVKVADRAAETEATKACHFADSMNATGAMMRGRGEKPEPSQVDEVIAAQTMDKLPDEWNKVSAHDDGMEYAKSCRRLHRQPLSVDRSRPLGSRD
jgi:hypothetical protein